ncbi:MAG: DUF3631 domain-containing protein [Gemmatimonas sp.]|nr:DUF3631 domain-containing protein [Gemmatimonas sp.]
MTLEAVDLMNGNARERLVKQVQDTTVHEVIRNALVTLAIQPPPANGADTPVSVSGLVRPVQAWPEPVAADMVLEALLARIAMHLHLPKHADVVVVAWLVLTYCLDVLPVAPLLWVRSPTRGCGKSTLLDLVTLLAARSLKCENATLSALFRLAERDRATLVLDELDQWLIGDRAGEITGLLNAGFSRGGRFLRSVGDDHEPKAFDVFGFRAVAGIGRTLHDTTRSRAYTITLERAPAGVHPRPLQAMHADTWADPMRQQLARLGEQLRAPLADALHEDAAHLPFPSHLDGRARDLWGPALALGNAIGGPFSVLLSEACDALTRRSADEEADIGVLLLLDIRRYFADHQDASVQPTALLAWLHDQEGSPWADYRQSRPLSARALHDLLKRFDIASTAPQWHEGTKARWLHAAMFADAWARYCPEPTEPDDSNAFPSAHPSHVLPPSQVSPNAGTDGTETTHGTLSRRETHCVAVPVSSVLPPGLDPVDEGYWRTLGAA